MIVAFLFSYKFSCFFSIGIVVAVVPFLGGNGRSEDVFAIAFFDSKRKHRVSSILVLFER